MAAAISETVSRMAPSSRSAAPPFPALTLPALPSEVLPSWVQPHLLLALPVVDLAQTTRAERPQLLLQTAPGCLLQSSTQSTASTSPWRSPTSVRRTLISPLCARPARLMQATPQLPAWDIAQTRRRLRESRAP